MSEWTLQKVSKNPKAALDEINRLSKEIEIRKGLSEQVNGEAGAYIVFLRSLIAELVDDAAREFRLLSLLSEQGCIDGNNCSTWGAVQDLHERTMWKVKEMTR